MHIFNLLHSKFSSNFEESINQNILIFEEAEVKSKVIYDIGEQLKLSTTSTTRLEIIEIFNELFSDTTVAIYLATCSIHHSSNIMMRRVLELGIAILYFWDMPHKYWGWKTISTHEADLSFKENVEYLQSAPYNAFLKNEYAIDNWICDKESINKYYRILSNTIHGKYETFATSSTDSFNFSLEFYRQNLETVINIENILINCLRLRFPREFNSSVVNVPSITRFNYGS